MFWLCYGEYRGKREVKPFFNYVLARIEQENRDFIYKIYVTESLRLQGEGKYLAVKFQDLFKEKKKERDSEEVVQTIMGDLGLNFGGKR